MSTLLTSTITAAMSLQNSFMPMPTKPPWKSWAVSSISSRLSCTPTSATGHVRSTGRDVYHYHLHVVYIPVVEKQILWSKRCKDKALRGTVKETSCRSAAVRSGLPSPCWTRLEIPCCKKRQASSEEVLQCLARRFLHICEMPDIPMWSVESVAAPKNI